MDLLIIAKEIADRVEAEAMKQNVPVAVTVIDIHGNVVLTHRMTGAPAFSLELAERKAYTSALIRLRTADLVHLVQPGAEPLPLTFRSFGSYCPVLWAWSRSGGMLIAVALWRAAVPGMQQSSW